MKNQKGITLIALVITIIVLLILAGVGIVMFTDDNGIFGKADQSAMDNAIAGAKDIISTEVQAGIVTYYENKYVSDSTDTAQTTVMTAVKDKFKTNETGVYSNVNGCTLTIDDSAGTIKVTKETRTTTGTVDSNGKLTWSAISNETKNG